MFKKTKGNDAVIVEDDTEVLAGYTLSGSFPTKEEAEMFISFLLGEVVLKYPDNEDDLNEDSKESAVASEDKEMDVHKIPDVKALGSLLPFHIDQKKITQQLKMVNNNATCLELNYFPKIVPGQKEVPFTISVKDQQKKNYWAMKVGPFCSVLEIVYKTQSPNYEFMTELREVPIRDVRKGGNTCSVQIGKNQYHYEEHQLVGKMIVSHANNCEAEMQYVADSIIAFIHHKAFKDTYIKRVAEMMGTERKSNGKSFYEKITDSDSNIWKELNQMIPLVEAKNTLDARLMFADVLELLRDLFPNHVGPPTKAMIQYGFANGILPPGFMST